MANSSNTAKYDDVDDAYGETSLRAYHDGPKWYKDGVNEIDAFFPEPRNSPPTTAAQSATIDVPDSASEDVPPAVEQPLPLPCANDTVATLQEQHGSSAEVPLSNLPTTTATSQVSPSLNQAQAAPFTAQHGGDATNAPSQTYQSSVASLTSESRDERGPYPLSLFAFGTDRNTASPSSPEHEEIYRGPDVNTDTEDSYMATSTSDYNITGTHNTTSSDPADAQDEGEIPSRTPKRKGLETSSDSDQPSKKQTKGSASTAEDGSDVEMVDAEDVDDEDPGQEESDGVGSGQEDWDEESDSSGLTPAPVATLTHAAPVAAAPLRDRSRDRGRSRVRGRGRGVATTGNAATQVTAATLALFNNNTLPPRYPFNHPYVSNVTIEGNWLRYGFISLAAARTYIRGRPRGRH